MSWYKTAQDASFQMARTIANWLVQAYRGPVDMHLVFQDLDNISQDPAEIDQAIMAGENMARSQLKQQGVLTQTQQDLLMAIQNRVMGEPQPVDGMQEQPPVL
jgi:hypothetical protein